MIDVSCAFASHVHFMTIPFLFCVVSFTGHYLRWDGMPKREQSTQGAKANEWHGVRKALWSLETLLWDDDRNLRLFDSLLFSDRYLLRWQRALATVLAAFWSLRMHLIVDYPFIGGI